MRAPRCSASRRASDEPPGRQRLPLARALLIAFQFSPSAQRIGPESSTGHAPVAFSLKRDYAEYQASYQIDNGVFTAGRKLTLREDELPVTRTTDYQSFRRAVAADLPSRGAGRYTDVSAGHLSNGEDVT